MSEEIERIERQLQYNKALGRHAGRVNYYDSDLKFVLAEIERLKAEVEKAKREGVIEGFKASRIISASETTHHYLYQTPEDYLSSLQPKAEEKESDE